MKWHIVTSLLIFLLNLGFGGQPFSEGSSQVIYYSHFRCYAEAGFIKGVLLELEEVRDRQGQVINGLVSPDQGESWLQVEDRHYFYSQNQNVKIVVWKAPHLTIKGYFADPEKMDVFTAKVQFKGRRPHHVECHLLND